MSQAIQTAIDELVAQIAAKEAELAPLKIAVNTLCRQIGSNDVYDNVTAGGGGLSAAPKRTLNWGKTAFYNRPLATCVAEIIEARDKVGLDKATSLDDLFATLKTGGYKFEGTSGSDENTKRAIKISLTKNTAQFVKLDDDHFSLKKWFGGSSAPRKKTNGKPSDSGDESEEASSSDEAESDEQEGKKKDDESFM